MNKSAVTCSRSQSQGANGRKARAPSIDASGEYHAARESERIDDGARDDGERLDTKLA